MSGSGGTFFRLACSSSSSLFYSSVLSPRHLALPTTHDKGDPQNRVHSTGRIDTGTIVSQQSPDWFKGPFHNNDDHFQQLNQVLAHKEEAIPVKGHLYRSGRVANGTIVNNDAPEWIRTTLDRNKEHFHATRKGANKAARLDAGAGQGGQARRDDMGSQADLFKEDPRLSLSQTRSLHSLGDAMRDRLVSEMYRRSEDPVGFVLAERRKVACGFDLTSCPCLPSLPFPSRRQAKVFMKWDTNGNGLLDRDEFIQGMTTYGFEPKSKAMDFLLKVADKNGDGDIDYIEFRDAFLDPAKVNLARMRKKETA